MKRMQFKTDPELMILIQPLDHINFLKLQDNIIHEGCSAPIYVWDETIIGGIEEYSICCSLNRPFNVRRLAFMNKYEAMSFICDEQLKRNDLRMEIRKYLFGKKYECELKTTNTSTGAEYSSSDRSEETGNMKMRKRDIAEAVGRPYSLKPSTIMKYKDYSTAVDYLRSQEPEIARRILTGQLKVSHANILRLGRLSKKEIEQIITSIEDYEIDRLSTADISRSLQWKHSGKRGVEVEDTHAEEPLIRKMPEYDPDSDISSLVLTIPSWIGSISKSVAQSDLEKASPAAINRLICGLYDLKAAIGKAESAVQEVIKNG